MSTLKKKQLPKTNQYATTIEYHVSEKWILTIFEFKKYSSNAYADSVTNTDQMSYLI